MKWKRVKMTVVYETVIEDGAEPTLADVPVSPAVSDRAERVTCDMGDHIVVLKSKDGVTPGTIIKRPPREFVIKSFTDLAEEQRKLNPVIAPPKLKESDLEAALEDVRKSIADRMAACLVVPPAENPLDKAIFARPWSFVSTETEAAKRTYNNAKASRKPKGYVEAMHELIEKLSTPRPDTDPALVAGKALEVDWRQPECECGAQKASGVTRGQAGHSSWCPWSKQ